jgi:predicted cupin superfamily sugar epimerase
MTADEIKKLFQLEPHPREGGYFVQTWRSEEIIPHAQLPERYSGPRNAGSAIYYLLEPGTFSEIHRLASDEVFHFYYGDPVEMLQLAPDGTGRTLILSNKLAPGTTPQLIAPKGVWQGSHLLPGGQVALLGCTVSPGFEYQDYETLDRQALVRLYPDFVELITSLTRE